MNSMLKRFARNQSGATAIEYTLIAAMISIAVIAAANTVGTNLRGKMGEIQASSATGTVQ